MDDIVVTGATGVIGRRVVRLLLGRGHRVTGVTRSTRGRALLEGLGARAVGADVYDSRSLIRAFAGADAVVNLLTRIPSATEMAAAGAWDENDRLRREASAVVARAAAEVGAHRLLQESVAFLYADGGSTWLNEDAPVAPGEHTATALAAEANAAALFPGDTVVLRFGVFIGPDSELTRNDVAQARAGVSPSVGRRGGHRPTVWLDDAASAVAAALAVPAGTYNVADAEPATRADIDAALAAVVGRSVLRPAIPANAVPPALEPLARSQRVSSRRLRDAGGWAPRVRAGTDGWALVVRQLEGATT